MKRINEKVKDIVEVRKFLSLRDFSESPAAILAAYRFTDATSDLMTKWLDRIAGLHDGTGAALALAGYRGVGKSHFLATLSAIVGNPDLRTKISESHVASGAQALLRRKYPSIHVRRGTRATLIDELKAAIAVALELDEASVPQRIFDLVALVRARSGDVPFLVLVDTAMERTSRVARDDGSHLAQMAEAVVGAGGMIGVALDDDIAGADGSNAAISGVFSIDYLDQEHLFKIVDSYVFPKKQHLRPVLHDVYEYFREAIPSFRWSEQRFSSLYPLHPAILDVAPFVRLYVNDFALLTFAAEAGERIMGRPANSLIALDEVFDSAESELRKVEALDEAFAAYDRLNSDVVARIPVMQRLQAKLILKALLILSLEGQGTTAGEISSGTLIFDENDPQKAARTVEEIIRMFAAAMPDDVQVYSEEGREVRYGLKVSGNDGLKQALEAAALSVSDQSVSDTLFRLFHERFSDSLFFSPDGASKKSIESTLSWRGGLRRGRVLWRDDHNTQLTDPERLDDNHDWEVVVDITSGESLATADRPELAQAVWKAAELNRDELDAIKRFFVLQNDLAIREQFSDQVRSSFHSHLLLLDRAVSRIFFEDGRMAIDGFDYNLSDEARSASTLSSLFSGMLEPLFESRFPEHPYFLQNLGLAEVSSLVSDLYSGSRQKLGEVQQLAQTFALPLGLVKLSEGLYYPANSEHLQTLDPVRRVESLLESSGSGAVQLDQIYGELRKPPYGLVREAQQLILTAMVSQRLVEFVTSKGDRINHRSLDLRMIWDDIVGLARPQDSSYSSEKLNKWARCFVDASDAAKINVDGDVTAFRTAAAAWLEKWDAERILGRFNEVAEESLSTSTWKLVTRTSRTLGASASLLRKWLAGQGSVEECLGRIAEAFLDDVERFKAATEDLRLIRVYLAGVSGRERIRTYVASAAYSGDPNVEAAREETISSLQTFDSRPSEENDRAVNYAFQRFLSAYSAKYLESHDSVMRSHLLQEQASELLASDSWWLFRNVAELAPEDRAVRSALYLHEMIKRFDCGAKTAEILAVSSKCSCGFEIPGRETWELSVENLARASEAATRSVLANISSSYNSSAALLSSLPAENNGSETSKVLADIEAFITSGKAPDWRPDHVRLLKLLKFASRPTDTSDYEKAERMLTQQEVESAVVSIA